MFRETPLSPACHHYVSYLLATAYAEPYEVLLGALLPCFWIYAEVGRDIHARAAAANPYQAWIDTYAGEEFHAAVRAMIAATDEAAAAASSSLRERMHAAFTRATQLEWMFWDSAFRLESLADIDVTLGILFFLQAAVLFFAGLAIMLSYGPAAMAGGGVAHGPRIACGLATMVVLQALGIIFQAGVCVCASTGVVPPSLDRDLTENAFRRKG